MTRPSRLLALAAATTSVTVLAAAGPAAADTPTDTQAFRDAVTVEGMTEHLQALQAAADAHGSSRASGTPGYEASAQYVEEQLRSAGYQPERQYFDFAFFQEFSPGALSRTGPDQRTYVDQTDFDVMDYSATTFGDPIEGPVKAVADLQVPPGAEPNSSTAGCEAEDFAGDFTGTIALLQRGTCDFGVKVANAAAAGAVGAIVVNEGQEGRTDVLLGTLGAPAAIPAVGASYAVGEELHRLSQAGEVRVSITTDTVSETRQTFNVIAQTDTGRTDRVVVVGAHLDSVPEGPGINDNGTGSAAILEIAEQLADVETRNAVRFAWWGAEESGLLGARHHVAQLDERGIADIALNLNFDMLGSPNPARFVYDGDGSATGTAGPNGSGSIEAVFTEYFASQGLHTEETAFDGRSDYGPFIAVGIPAGGLFSGAEGVKTPEQAAPERFGGVAGVAYDECYHQACDDIGNVDPTGLDQLADGAAHAVLTFARTSSAVNGTAQGGGGGAAASGGAAVSGGHDHGLAG
ncbi:M20/M25/M40 family metallo-hydrolase [Geodermatophilus maliterrae]|uniref:M20/M25/M40 family metallo-hydrolase n=1 Tax=Geodermatophilus maliterrae TaxID=3162531 RepID=A0ABV3XH63_9ACTN